jgi:phosphopantetheine adenylyltransferase
MTLWTFLAVIIVVGILADTYSKHQKNKMRFQGNDKKINELNETIKKLEKRIENLEIIAVSDPDNFQDRAAGNSYAAREQDPSRENQRLVNELAKNKTR